MCNFGIDERAYATVIRVTGGLGFGENNIIARFFHHQLDGFQKLIVLQLRIVEKYGSFGLRFF